MVKKILSYLNALYVTPGPFTIFRRSIFKKIGPFRHAHNTEDMEMAMRMHINHLQIENCHKGFVYTVGPSTLKKLYKQRVRWTHGFLENIIDYKHVFFKKRYGHVAFITLPFTVASLASVVMIVLFILWNVGSKIYEYIVKILTVGFHFNLSNIDFSLIYINTQSSLFISAILLIITIFLMLGGRRITEEKLLTKRIIYFFVFYPFIAPFWVGRSIFNTALRKKTSWR
jgi:cellulose synthase/poly-beta-1,6-N-acetylglucosamine synthase-like glycosyltransferase